MLEKKNKSVKVVHEKFLPEPYEWKEKLSCVRKQKLSETLYKKNFKLCGKKKFELFEKKKS